MTFDVPHFLPNNAWKAVIEIELLSQCLQSLTSYLVDDYALYVVDQVLIRHASHISVSCRLLTAMKSLLLNCPIKLFLELLLILDQVLGTLIQSLWVERLSSTTTQLCLRERILPLRLSLHGFRLPTSRRVTMSVISILRRSLRGGVSSCLDHCFV